MGQEMRGDFDVAQAVGGAGGAGVGGHGCPLGKWDGMVRRVLYGIRRTDLYR